LSPVTSLVYTASTHEASSINKNHEEQREEGKAKHMSFLFSLTMNENNNCNEVTQTPPTKPPTVIAPQSQSTISDFSPASFGRQQEHQAIVWVQHLAMARTKKTVVAGKTAAAKKKPR
jgi:hypothetical protein